MFCSRCGVLNPDDHAFCKACGYDLGPPVQTGVSLDPPSVAGRVPAATGTRSASTLDRPPSVLAVSNKATELRGVGGWLLLFCVGLTVISPLFVLAEAVNSKDIPTIAIDLGLAALYIYSGIGLWRVKTDSFKWLKVCFVVNLILGLLGILGSIWTQPDSLEHKLSSSNDLASGARPIIGVVIWWSYFRNSKRVRATYGRNL
jgi:uncharacterized protein DUF2569/zinc ribbon protein